MSQYFSKPYRSIGGNTDASNFTPKSNLVSLKTEVDKLDIDKLKPVPVDLSKLSEAVKNEVVKKTVYDRLDAIVNNIDISRFVLKTKYHIDKAGVNSFIKNTHYNTKISENGKNVSDHNHGKYITTPEFNNLAAGVVTARLAQANLVAGTEFDAKLESLNKKINSNKAKHVLVANELVKLQTFDSSYFKGKNHFEKGGQQNYLIFQPMYK